MCSIGLFVRTEVEGIMTYTIFVFDGNFANYADQGMNKIIYRNASADDARKIIEIAMKHDMDVVIRRGEQGGTDAESR